MSHFKIELGAKVKDKVSGFSGVVMARTQYLTQCNTYGISPTKLTKDGKRPDWEWIDEDRLQDMGGKKLDLVAPMKPKTGGPHYSYEGAPGK